MKKEQSIQIVNILKAAAFDFNSETYNAKIVQNNSAKVGLKINNNHYHKLAKLHKVEQEKIIS